MEVRRDVGTKSTKPPRADRLRNVGLQNPTPYLFLGGGHLHVGRQF
jgi:hypothetical protein